MQATWGIELLFSIIWLALIVSLGAYCLLFYMLRLMSAVRVSSLEFLAPPMTMLLAYFIFAERLSNLDLAGLALATVAVWLVVGRKPKGDQATSLSTAQKQIANMTNTATDSFPLDISLDQSPASYADQNSLTLVSDSMSLTSSSNNLNDLIDLVIYQQERINTLLHEAEQRETFRNSL